MIPLHMGLMGSTPAVLLPSPMTVISKPAVPRKEGLLARPKEDENSGPTTTVFVGNISEKASDVLIRQLLAKCGIVLSWKRVQGASGKLQAFGFCEYKEPESTLRALRLLHEMQIGDKGLLVKVDAKTKAQLDEWKAKKKTTNGKDGGGDEEEVLDEETKKKDQIVKGAIDGLLREHSSELNAPSLDDDAHRRNRRKKEKKEEEDINAIDGLEDDKRDLISREISKFRDTHKKLEEEKDKREKERAEFERERKDRAMERERERERRDHEREKEKERDRERERERDRDNRSRDRERADRDRRTKERERERDWDIRDKSIERSRSRERSRDRDKDKKRDQEDEEDVYERRRVERKLREKEAAYQERLKNWELRERKKARDHAKETEREDERRREMVKEGKRLKEFLEDYDDDRDDPKYYRGSALQKRLRDREKEIEVDERDRKREQDELQEIRQRLLAEGHPDPDAELRRMEEEEERLRQPPVVQEPEPEPEEQRKHHNKASRDHRGDRGRGDRDRDRGADRDRRDGGRPPRVAAQSEDEVEEGEEDDYENEDEDNPHSKPSLKPTLRPITAAPSVSSVSSNASPNTPGGDSPCGIIIPHENSPPEALPQEEHRPKIGLSLKMGAAPSPSQPNAAKRKKPTVESVFNRFDDEETDERPRKRKLVPLDYDDEKSMEADAAALASVKGADTEEKRKHIKSLIEKIPTGKPELFSYPLDWSMVDTLLMERRVRPWINKKIIEYIGEEEPTLVDFVCSKVMAHGTPQRILDDVAMVLDEEAEVFIVKMWRLLIYETEAKKIGLVK